MKQVRQALRRWLHLDELRRDTTTAAQTLESLNRQMVELRALVHQQGELTMEALHRAGWQDDEEKLQQKSLQRAAKAIHAQGDVIAGPWTGEVGFELLYWIPFLAWLVEQGLDGQRLIVVSRGGAAPWYRHLTSRYIDLLDVLTPDEFRDRTGGKKKQYDATRELDRELTARVSEKLGLRDVTVIHPSAMFRLFAGVWRRKRTVDLVESFTAFRALTPPPPLAASELPPGLPRDYVAAKFYFSKAFPDTAGNREFVSNLLQTVSRQVPVALMSTSVRLDDHHDFQPAGGSGLYVIDAHQVPQQNLERQTQVICGARGFVGTYGGFSYLAPFYGVRSVSFFSRREGFEDHHLDLANRVFDRLLPGGFIALDRRAADLVEPAVTRWVAEAPRVPVLT